jgi:hypothetical protein
MRRRLASLILAFSFGAFPGCSGSGSTQAAGSPCASVENKLRSCNLLSEGVFCGAWDLSQCEADCVSNASCSVLQAAACETSPNAGGELEACLANCREPEFACTNGESVPERWACDGYPDCSDGSDELGCPVFTCANGQTIPDFGKCDSYPECSDGSDELGCPVFTCASGGSVPVTWKCDGALDCSDGSDELNCPQRAELQCPGP